MSESEGELSVVEFNEIMDEKELLVALVENRWTVELTENFYSLFEESEWLDEDVRERVAGLWENTETILENFEEPNGYDTEAMRRLDDDVREQYISILNDGTRQAMQYAEQLFSTLEGQQDIVQRLPDLIEDVLEENLDHDVQINNDEFAQYFEENFDYAVFLDEFDYQNLASLIAGELDGGLEVEVDGETLAENIDVDEEVVASYVADELDEEEIGRYVKVNASAGPVNVDEDTLESAFNSANISVENEVNLTHEDYRSIGKVIANNLGLDEMDIDYSRLGAEIVDIMDYGELGAEIANNLDGEIDIDGGNGDDTPPDPDSEGDYEPGLMEKIGEKFVDIGIALNYGGDDI